MYDLVKGECLFIRFCVRLRDTPFVIGIVANLHRTCDGYPFVNILVTYGCINKGRFSSKKSIRLTYHTEGTSQLMLYATEMVLRFMVASV